MKVSTGGMQTAGTPGGIYCPKCGKRAYRAVDHGTYTLYYHYTNNAEKARCHRVEKMDN